MTDDREIYERTIALGHYERNDERIETESLHRFGVPIVASVEAVANERRLSGKTVSLTN